MTKSGYPDNLAIDILQCFEIPIEAVSKVELVMKPNCLPILKVERLLSVKDVTALHHFIDEYELKLKGGA